MIKTVFWLSFLISALGVGYFKASHFFETSSDKNEVPVTLDQLGFTLSPSKENFSEVAYEEHDKSSKKIVQKKISDMKKPCIVHFWATWCSPCVKELPKYEAFIKEMKKHGIETIAISPDDITPDKVIAFFDKLGISDLSVVIDKTKEIAQRFGLDALPTTIFIDGKNEEIGRISGVVPWGMKGVKDLVLNLFKIKVS
jgi:thiol-disulfide isomerase/thioredoxin